MPDARPIALSKALSKALSRPALLPSPAGGHPLRGAARVGPSAALRRCVLPVLLVWCAVAQAQVADPREAVRDKAADRANNAVDRGVDRALDRAEEAVKRLFRRKDKAQPSAEGTAPAGSGAAVGAGAAVAAGTAAGGATAATGAAIWQAYSKFDFRPGEQVLAYEDFQQDAQGDFPARWNTSAGGELVRIEGQSGLWLQMPSAGVAYPEFVAALPENFTLEYDMMVGPDMSEHQSGLRLHFVALASRTTAFDAQMGADTQVGFDLHPLGGDGGHSVGWVIDKNGQRVLDNTVRLPWKAGVPNRISVWRQQARVRLYVNEVKVWDLPRAFQPGVSYSLLWSANLFSGSTYIGPVRLAAGAPDTRSKLLSEGPLVTRGILFDVNADRIRPESHAVLKEIAGVLAENPSVNVLIVGHTDSDGDDAHNLELSRRRAEAVKTALAGGFGIAAARMTTEGQGARQPAEPNSTPQGKASNRRVEFVRR